MTRLESMKAERNQQIDEVFQFTVPTITLEGDANGAPHPDATSYAKKFSANMHTGSSRAASGTICLRKPRRTLPKLLSMWTLIDRVNA
jgi:hypothetical protein